MKKVTTAAAALVLGGALVASGQSAQAAPLAAADLPAAGHQTAYVQRADTVTVYRDGKVLAKVTAESAAHPRGKGKLVLTVEAKKAFSVKAGQFLWEDEDGGDTEAVNPDRKIRVAANRAKTVTIDYRGVGNGDVIWVPGPVAGAWLVEGRAVEGAAKLLSASYVQRGSTVTVYKAGKVVAKVTPQYARHNADTGKGTLGLRVEALKKISLNPASFIWEDADGGDNEAAPGQKKIVVKAKTSANVTVKYTDVPEAGGVFWTPREDILAGAWTND